MSGAGCVSERSSRRTSEEVRHGQHDTAEPGTASRGGSGSRSQRRLPQRRSGVRRDAELRPERHRPQPDHAAGRDPDTAGLRLDAAGAQPVRLATLRGLLPAGDVRVGREPARLPARLLHAGRRARRAAGRRRDQRRDRRLQPVHARVRGPKQLLALGVEPDAQRAPAGHAAGVRAEPGRGPRLHEQQRPVRGLAGLAGAPCDRQRQPVPAGLLRAGVHERRLLRGR